MHARNLATCGTVRAVLLGTVFCFNFGSTVLGGEVTIDQVKGSDPYVETARRYLEGAQPKIIGGDRVKSGTHRWQTSLQVAWIADGVQAHFCGGSLIAPEWVLTAGHCVEDLRNTDFTILAGTIELRKAGQRRSVKNILLHKNYATDMSNLVAGPHPVNDVALIKVFAPFAAGANVQTIKLTDAQAEDSIAKPQNLVTVTGFGATKVGGKPVPGLMGVNVHYVERSTCNKGASYDGAITNGMICAGEDQGGQDSCQGDSGGPLTFHPLSSDATQIGIVSWGRQCAKELKYGVYTRIVAYRDWIMACMANPNTCPAK